MGKILELRDYQIPATEYIMSKDRSVLAVCPNGGKTEISIFVITKYLEINPNAKVLVLTHSTNVLLDNFLHRLESLDLPFLYSDDFNHNTHVHVCLPHRENHIKGKYDFVIVDEAHENYLAPRVQRILEKVKPSKQLLLTGTPSKFIKESGYDIYAIAANEISDEWFSKLSIELVASDYNWKGYYTRQLEVQGSYQFKLDNTRTTLENVMVSIINRFKNGLTAEEFNNPNFLTKVKTWAFAYKKIGKTMIVCRAIEQAEMVHQILLENNVNSAISHSMNDEDDSDANVIDNFKNDKFDVLVVVNRARLGYNDPNLMNLIDVSGTHNPDIIYQMFCRVLRGTPDTQKYYLKLTSKDLIDMATTHIYTCIALMLTDKNFLLCYNGTNINNSTIPIIKKPITPISVNDINKPQLPIKKHKNRNILPEFTNDVVDMFKNILHNLNNPASIFKMTSIGDVRRQLGENVRPKIKTLEDLLISAKGNI